MLDKKYDFKTKEEKWLNYWNEIKLHEFKLNEKEVYSIDTPPPTVSGNIHLGHIFSYSQTEMIARYKRLKGYNVFYPFGFDDNGLPSERLVEKEHNNKAHQLTRSEFQKLCYETTNKYEKDFQRLFQRMGFSADFENAYKTVSDSTIRISQLSFLDLYKHQKVYHKESPSLWCNECLTSIAQAELETKTVDSTFNYIKFKTEQGLEFEIATTRPELLPAIVAVFINPTDPKNNHLIGLNAVIPIVNKIVPIIGDEKVDKEKGTGIVMNCTFGDQTDIEWWTKYDLPLVEILTDYGRINDTVPDYAGLKVKEAREKILEDLKHAGVLVKSEPLTHEVNTHERCGKEIEYKVVKQWFIDLMNYKDKFIEMGRQVKWHPDFMRIRYEEWVNNVGWDWCISRQRYFGVPFPVWYCNKCGKAIVAREEDLPVNPLEDKPHRPCTCGCKTYVPERDVMDTWATSSVTPLINMRYKTNDSLEKYLRPMSLRANGHDIIRTWDFYTIVKSYFHFGEIPWKDTMISGFILASKGEKLSKRKSNDALAPDNLINEYSADVVRYWAGSGRLGNDITFTDESMLRGRKLVNKIYNVASFINMHLEDYEDKEFNDYEFFDKWIISNYQEMKESYLNYLDEYEVGLALNTLEKFFWNFCDNYIEIVKHRLYRPEEFKNTARYSGQKTIYTLLYKLLQDFSIFFPFITEELYQNINKPTKSIHQTEFEELKFDFQEENELGDILIEFISEVRGQKTIKQLSLKNPIDKLNLKVNAKIKTAVLDSLDDLKATLTIKELNLSEFNESNYLIEDIVFGALENK